MLLYYFSLTSGGITLTVEGKDLQVVQTHFMVITMVYKKSQNGGYVIVSQEKFTSVSELLLILQMGHLTEISNNMLHYMTILFD